MTLSANMVPAVLYRPKGRVRAMLASQLAAIGPDLLIVLVIGFVVIFGGSQLPKLAKNAGEALHEFKRTQSGHQDSAEAAADVHPTGANSNAGISSSAATSALPGSASENTVTISQAQYEELLAARRAHSEDNDLKSSGS